MYHFSTKKETLEASGDARPPDGVDGASCCSHDSSGRVGTSGRGGGNAEPTDLLSLVVRRVEKEKRPHESSGNANGETQRCKQRCNLVVNGENQTSDKSNEAEKRPEETNVSPRELDAALD